MIKNTDLSFTTNGDPRGYIQPEELKELWFNTGTRCNLSCPFCFEGANPINDRLEQITLADVKPFIDEAVAIGIKKFSFTGGEPFVNSEFIDILRYALEYRPCLVLTNATEPLRNKLAELGELKYKKDLLSFRVSLDSTVASEHDKNRGQGHFDMSLHMMKALYEMGFNVSAARQIIKDENTVEVDKLYRELFVSVGLPEGIYIAAFPDLLLPCSHPDVPQITENCMTTYKSEAERRAFMCNYSKMVVKTNGSMGVYACTLVDDDPDYNLGETLDEALKTRVMLRHHRCFSCFSAGTSCSEG